MADIPGAILEPVLADASERSGVPRAALVIVRASAVIWSDGSLGCPEPGMFYTQALVDGHHIVVAAGDRELDYRLDASGTFRLCGNPGPLPSGAVVDR